MELTAEGDDAVDQRRFTRTALLGVGAFGRVYRAFDRQRRTVVALKVMHDAGSEATRYLKREFRTLAALAHPNVVELLDLVVTPTHAYFTMEYVDGAPFAFGPQTAPSERLARLLQVVRGLRCIHDAGFVHRDLKPPNVLVTPAGRVVLLDCGLSSRIVRAGEGGRAEEPVGSPVYMAPELWSGAQPHPAQDVFALGVMAYEALTARLPFSGEDVREDLSARDAGAFAPLTEAAGLPAAVLARLNRALSPDPSQRPSLQEFEEVLAAHATSLPRARGLHPRVALVGRGAELAALREVLEGRAARNAVQLVGPSGAGKSRLLDEALARAPAGTVVLRAACHPLEAVLLPALDGLIEPLAEHLASWPLDARAALASVDGALGQMFPCLAELVSPEEEPAASPLDLRRRAAHALTELLRRAAARAPLALVVDDAQWGDRESWALLRESLDALARDDVRAVIASRHCLPELADATRVITLAPLSEDESRALLARAAEGADDADLARACEAARGNPLALVELAGAALPVGADGAWLEGALAQRLADAPPEALPLLTLTAVAAEPTPVSLLTSDPRELVALETLRRRRLIDYDTAEREQRVACAHAWVREAALSRAPREEVRAQHLRLADALIERGAAPERVVAHLRAAGDRARLREHALRAAARAEARLDFHRAAEFLEIAATDGGDRSRETALRRAENLQRAGRGKRAAEVFVDLARGVEHTPEGADLLRRAAEQLLFAGQHERGVAIVRQSLAARGVRLVTNPALAFGLTFVRATRLRRRGLDYAGPGDAAAPEDRARIDALRNAVLGLSMSEPVSSAALQGMHLRLAADRGTRAQYVYALGVHMVQMAGYDYDPARTTALVARVEAMAPTLGDDDAVGFHYLAASGAAWVEGRFREALDYAESAARRFTDRRRTPQWSLDSLQIVRAAALAHLGRWAPLRPLVHEALDDARAREDLYLESNLCVRFLPRVHLLDDEPARALRALERGRRAWLGQRYGLIDFFLLLTRAEVLLYQGDADGALALLGPGLRKARLSMLLTLHYHAVLALELTGRALLARAARGDRRALARARSCAKRLGLAGSPVARAHGAMLDAGARAIDGDPSPARRAYLLAAEAFEALGVEHFLAAARWRAGAAVDPRDQLRAQGFVNPDALLHALAPGAG